MPAPLATRFIVSQPGGDRVSAQQRAKRCLQIILMHADMCQAWKISHVPYMFLLRCVFFTIMTDLKSDNLQGNQLYLLRANERKQSSCVRLFRDSEGWHHPFVVPFPSFLFLVHRWSVPIIFLIEILFVSAQCLRWICNWYLLRVTPGKTLCWFSISWMLHLTVKAVVLCGWVCLVLAAIHWIAYVLPLFTAPFG